ncbi:tRNA lysidine(34) synthetase TilS [Lihuaxuella thermophila]|uniref:tRNA(Ile)-lysidine synthase n=1 Tax=Lihuaxuella thermophila TaxID=1173111 RepID=A0A1H8I689_9BACL|nr:tRNA lysidine(34) synthetase TilS [Lihuaxuella thermophila]SEN63707.1 tRNA(Ile)-lysidine synthase [Lihuaxuella thermophila]
MFLDQLKKEIEQHQMIRRGEKVLVGVSGGPDSLALLHGLRSLGSEYGWSLFVIHVNHGLRGKESEEDARFVKECCEKWQIPCRIETVDVNSVLRREGGNKQAIARKLRYRAFRKAAESWRADKLALAHHADDQVETILMRIIRGTGVGGLRGMEKIRRWHGIDLIRPLLSISREMIESYCGEQGLNPRLDKSNLSPAYTRNRVRLELLPLLSTYNPRVKEAILQLSEIIREEEKVWEEMVTEACRRVVKQESTTSFTLDLSSFLHFSVALQRRIVKLILSCLLKQGTNEATLTSIEQVRQVAAHPNPSAEVDLPGGVKAERQYHLLTLTLKEIGSQENQPIAPIPLSVPGMTSLPGFMGKIEVIVSGAPLDSIKPCRDFAVFDACQIDEPVMVRSRKQGDRMTCFGMAGTKKLKDLFIEAKIPRQVRDSYPIVTAGEHILWVPGIRRSKLAMITPRTKQFLYMLWHDGEEEDAFS